ncbi:MAG: Beta-N-acetylglucosaminidase/beta-glucosidase [Firmicutes bacterium ADurb.Bin193]|nr:MAG: Beta-N-acetylglucosaminidase/beta-glucosidase [Firmicutes bacterium ADurb.Bin193]
MLPPLEKTYLEKISQIESKMTLHELAAQVLCPLACDMNLDEIKEMLDKYPIGTMFVADDTKERCLKINEMMNAASNIPGLICADLEGGPGWKINDCTLFPWPMTLGASDSLEHVRIMGESTAKEGRACGVHWTLAPVTDLLMNKFCPCIGVRAWGDEPKHISRMVNAFVKSVQHDGLMAATAKHFPGEGTDSRDTHMSVPVNKLSEKEWFDTYGYVWKNIIDSGVMTVMVSHINLDFVDSTPENTPPVPGCLSKNVIQGLLRGRLGFDGVVISDAIKMCGCSSSYGVNEIAWRLIDSGVDVVLFSTPDYDHKAIVDAVQSGKLSEERLRQAVRKILELKARLGLFDDEAKKVEVSNEDKQRYLDCVREISERGIKIVRDMNSTLPLNLDDNSKILTISLFHEHVARRGRIQHLDKIDEALKQRGFIVDHLDNPPSEDVRAVMGKYKAIFVNFHFPPQYGTTRMDQIQFYSMRQAFWRDHPCVVFTSFCQPSLIYEFNFLPNLVLSFSNTPESQEAAVKVWFGEIPVTGKYPIGFEDYFSREVE